MEMDYITKDMLKSKKKGGTCKSGGRSDFLFRVKKRSKSTNDTHDNP